MKVNERRIHKPRRRDVLTVLYPRPPCAGVDSFDVSLEKQKAYVKGTADYDTVMEKIQKTGKEVKGGRVVA